MARRRHGHTDETEISPLINDDGENDDADFQHTDGTFTQAAGHSTGSTENMRFVVLGSDNNLMNKVPAFILGESQSFSRCRPAICTLIEGHVHGRHVSVVTTPVNWLERLKSFWFFKNAVKSLKNEMEICESLVFPGPHAFLLVIDGTSSKELCLLDAIKEAFGQEALDYSMVLFIKESHNQKNNSCVKACGNRYHIINSTNQSVADLFVKVETMTQNKKSKCLINNFEFFEKVSAHLHREYKTEYEKKESELMRKLTEMNKTVQNLQKEISDLKSKVDLKDTMLQEERQKLTTLEQKLTEAGVKQSLLTKGHPRTAQRPEVPEHKDEREIESREEESQASGSQMFVRVRRGSKETETPNMSLSKGEKEGEIETREEDSQISGSQTSDGLKTLRRGSKEIDPLNVSKSEHGQMFVL
ncbi:uncharacterized protein [Garra rufa]|uniref:uncharacterized protein n=1 Tax=Garra rufa TaxID=137080 RepID=UPI003CCEC022